MAGWIPEPEQWSFAIDVSRIDEFLAPCAEVEEFLREFRLWLETPEGRFDSYYAARTRP